MRYMIWMGIPGGIDESGKYIFPFAKVPCGAKIVLYGAGNVGRIYFHQVKKQDIVMLRCG